MPAVSEEQRRLFCLALAIKRGTAAKSDSEQAAQMAESMSEETLKDYCGSPVKKE